MNELSVHISGAERAQISKKAVDLFLKTAKARHPDPTFYTDISKRIYLEALEDIREHLNSPLYKQMYFISKFSFARSISQLKMPNDINILSLCDMDTRFTKMLFSNNYLNRIEEDDIIIPQDFIHGDKVLFPFKSYGDFFLILSPEILNDISDYNAKMLETYNDLSTQLSTLINVINRCKTTKTFYKELPNLTSLFPNSLLNKISKKNDNGTEKLTEEQELMQAATNAIATANLLGD